VRVIHEWREKVHRDNRSLLVVETVDCCVIRGGEADEEVGVPAGYRV
jgi:hypothetical protein